MLSALLPTKPSAAKTLDSKASRGTRFALSLIAFGANKFSVCQRPFWTFCQEIFENERTLAAIQRAAAGQARNFANSSRFPRAFSPN
jgi:hypothetical protein